MAFPSSPTDGQSYTENNTVWIYSAATGQWYRSVISQVNETTYIGADGAPSGIGGDTQVIFNSNGSFAGDAGLVYNKTTDALTTGSLKVTSLGTAAAPSISVTGDTNTGIYSPGADQVAISTNGSNRLHIDSSGRLLVGTNTAGDYGLAYVGNTSRADTTVSILASPTGTSQFHFSDSLSGAGQYAGYFAYNHASNAFQFATDSTERMRIDSSGRVGIGTSSPAVRLTVEGSSADTSPTISTFTGGHSAAITSFSARAGLELLSYQSSGSPYTKTSAIVANSDGTTPSVLQLWTKANGQSSPAERVRIDSDGKVGIGTTSPAGALDVQGSAGNYTYIRSGADARLYLKPNGTNTGLFYADASSVQLEALGSLPLTFYTNSAERARIDSGGRFLVGTSAPFGPYHDGLMVNGSAGITARFGRFTNDAFGGALAFLKGRGGSPGTRGIVQNNDYLGYLEFYGDDGSALVPVGARISAEVDGIPGVNDMPGRLVFSTTADGASSPTERMRITSTGQVRLAGAGITFNGDTATANELDDYEEGTWTPSDASGAGLTFTSSGTYTKIGRLITLRGGITFPSTVSGAGVKIGGLPFAHGTASQGCGFTAYVSGSGPGLVFRAHDNTSEIYATRADDQDNSPANSTFATLTFQFMYSYHI